MALNFHGNSDELLQHPCGAGWKIRAFRQRNKLVQMQTWDLGQNFQVILKALSLLPQTGCLHSKSHFTASQVLLVWVQEKLRYSSFLYGGRPLKSKANTVTYEPSLERIFLFRPDCLASRLWGELYISYLFRVNPEKQAQPMETLYSWYNPCFNYWR